MSREVRPFPVSVSYEIEDRMTAFFLFFYKKICSRPCNSFKEHRKSLHCRYFFSASPAGRVPHKHIQADDEPAPDHLLAFRLGDNGAWLLWFSTWSCSRRHGPTLILSEGIVCRICTVWPKRRKLLLRPWIFLQTCSPRAGSSVSFTGAVGFLYNFLKRPGYGQKPWFLVARCLIVYYELLTYCCLES